MESDNRKKEEMDFHNKREVDRNNLSNEEYSKKYSNKKFYSITESSKKYVEEWLSKNGRDKVVLDYCCGLGDMSLRIARQGAKEIHGFDISEESVKTARKLLQSNGYEDRSFFSVDDAEGTKHEDDKFDVIICSGVLHHLDLNKAYPELRRILKPGGTILCIEALGHNPIIQLYRNMTPKLRTAWETEHILKVKDLKKAKSYFKNVNVKYFHLFTIMAVIFRKTFLFKPVLFLLKIIDSIVLRIPGIRLMSWQMIFELR